MSDFSIPLPWPAIVCSVALAAWLLVAAWTDIRTRRIPNVLVASGMLCGLMVQALAPAGSGLFDGGWGGLGIVTAGLGLLTGLALFMPLYIFRVVGAGDVKLLAMVGAWLGPQFTLAAALLTLLAGGLLAIIVMLASRSSLQVLANVRMMLTTVMIGAHSGRLVPLDAPAEVSTRLPYALAIAVGSLAQVGWLLVQSSA
jgi:prepilin peptidase CpaA